MVLLHLCFGHQAIRTLAKAFESRIMSHLMRWDQHAPWAPPFIWPPMGGEESMRRYGQMLHAEGHLLGLYGSGTSFTCKSRINDYSSANEYQKNQWERFMARGPHGEIDASQCAQIRHGFSMCITKPWALEVFKEQVRGIASAGVDFVQLMDQNLGGGCSFCYSQEHHHPELPGKWQTEAMQEFLGQLNDVIKETGSRAILGTECAAAESYVGELPMNDLRSTFVQDRGMPVPLHQFVFHEYCFDFMGNQVFADKLFNCAECPENILWRTAYAFNAGALLSVTLRGAGVVDRCAGADWKSEPPEQARICTLIRNLNALRRKYPEFLLAGRMMKPVLKLSGGTFALKMVNRDDEKVDSFTHSCWRSADGKLAQSITLVLPPLDARVLVVDRQCECV